MMIELDKYLYDGADWQSKAILAFLQSQYETILGCTYIGNFQYDAMLRVNRYDNVGDREHGFVVSVIYKWKKQRTIAFYEHRNVDNVFVIHRDGYIGLDNPNPKWLYDDKTYPTKYDKDKEFKYGEILECGKYIKNQLMEFLEQCIEEEKNEKKVEE